MTNTPPERITLKQLVRNIHDIGNNDAAVKHLQWALTQDLEWVVGERERTKQSSAGECAGNRETLADPAAPDLTTIKAMLGSAIDGNREGLNIHGLLVEALAMLEADDA